MALLVLAAAVIVPIGWPVRAQDDPTPTPERQEIQTIGLYEKFEITLDVPGDIANPYDWGEAQVWGNFTARSGQSYQIPAFYIQPYEQTCQADCSAEVLAPLGQGEWRLRFTPTELGLWRYNVRAKIGDATEISLTAGSFEAVESANPGFVRTAGRYFEFENDTPYFPIGQNLGWSWDQGGGIFTYLAWLDKLAAAGANYARVYIDTPWFIGLEWTAPAGQYGEEGQKAAWRLDTIIEAAHARGIYLQLVLVWSQAFRQYTGVPVAVPPNPPRPAIDADFDNNPYNKTYGGVISEPNAVWTDRNAESLLENRLHYIAARWGYSTSVFAWEITDALDSIAGYNAITANEWLNRMIDTLHQADAFTHLVTVGTDNLQSDILANPLLDFLQAQVYQARPIEQAKDQVATVLNGLTDITALTTRPVLLTEFSLNPWFEPTADDPSGVHIRDTIWPAALSGSAGGAMSWWWDTYLDPQNLYDLYTPLALFTQGIAWNKLNLQPIDVALVAQTEVTYDPLHIEDFNRTFRDASPSDVTYRITGDGVFPPSTQLSSYLYGNKFNAENRHPHAFIIFPPVDTTLRIGIQNVSTAAGAQLVVTLDGDVATQVDLAAGTQTLTITLPIVAGQHDLVLDNLGEDWLQIEYLEIEAYTSPVRAITLADPAAGVALVWVHHRDYTWETVLAGDSITPLPYQMQIPGMGMGEYLVDYWDTLTGNVIGEERVTLTTDEATINLDLPPINTQLALKVFRVAGPNK
ncbi:MAG: DUF5060 domain-containing protein [Chloroflexi bacterium]|nr:DUF5060 domain-containing protein [Chloroflexota bacterium]